MKKSILLALPFLLMACGGARQTDRALSREILSDMLMVRVDSMARAVIRTGFTAGDHYGEVWIRDLNTFIEISCQEYDRAVIRENLLTFFRFQGPGGDIVDGFIPKGTSPIDYAFRYSDLAPQYAAHKNTVETDQESALIQAICKYVKATGDRSILDEVIAGKNVRERLEWAMDWLLSERYSAEYGLLWGATTADWGDIQPETSWGVVLDENTHLALDIYDNAMFVLALEMYFEMLPEARRGRLGEVQHGIRERIMEHLWDAGRGKFIPHIYLSGSPFPADFLENDVFYHGGTTVAIEAGLLTPEHVKNSYEWMLRNVKESGAASVGLTMYPPYPEGFFKNADMRPYSYQNGGDWTWFGGRTVSTLVDNGFVREAYDALQPMLERVVVNKGFYEWYSVDNKPSGSGTFRGSAGVLSTAIEKLQAWAEANK